MNLIINERINFNEEQGTLSTADTSQDPIILAKPSCRLLSLLIKHNGELLTRDYLLTNVWEIHGLTASNNNLNNYLSMLRKAFLELGENNMVVTVPKQGFMLAASHITTDNIDNKLPPYPEESRLEQRSIQTRKNKFLFSLIWMTIFVVVLVPLAVLLITREQAPVPIIQVTPIGKIVQCNVGFLLPPYKTISKISLLEIKAVLERFGYNCENPAQVYFHQYTAPTTSDSTIKSQYLLTYCPKNSVSISNLHCENIHVKE